ncbi:nucleotide exchange factor GrpE [Chloroflexota bacterium]
MQSKQVLEDTTMREKDYLDLLRRTQADFTNYRHRVERKREEQAKCASADLVLKLLPVLDDFDRARQATPDQAARADWARGIELIEKKLAAVLEEEGLSTIEAEGKVFKPEEHEALSYEESDEYEEGRVKAVFANGYRLNGRVIRPAQVAVSKGRKKDGNTATGRKQGGMRSWLRHPI